MPHSKRLGVIYVVTALGALIGALIHVLGFSASFDSGAAAYVNGQAIQQAEYARALKAMQAGIERPLTQEDRDKALKLLIDEELIVQESLRLGLASSDRLVRKNMVQAMMRSATSLGDSKAPTDAEIRRFFDANKAVFAVPKKLSLTIAKMPNDTQSRGFLHALKGNTSFEDAARSVGWKVETLPRQIPLAKVSSLLGGSAAKTADKMTGGEIAGPVTSGGQDIFIWLTQLEGGHLSYEQTKSAVRTELIRRKDEAALDAYVLRLRNRARIKMGNPAP